MRFFSYTSAPSRSAVSSLQGNICEISLYYHRTCSNNQNREPLIYTHFIAIATLQYKYKYKVFFFIFVVVCLIKSQFVWFILLSCFHSGHVQRTIPAWLDRVLPLRQRHTHQESECLGRAQRRQSREPEWVDVARLPISRPVAEPRNLTSSRAWI